ncbi:S41 family peptidase [Fictibacillus sp. WQ 8-8]|uniref:S41 family peptidase n=1 Tax=unclassified Fictibacillus TaxID=2644029 RepID=UPI00078284D0|nr:MULTISPECIES: S41 family peptidase [unclassified Fictibacillus]MCQ6264355.1 S41 family peptidase [Fictibacillus sp. WQ 8-8]SFD42965.1 carboxyl-terminal processing protease [Bacillus sp. OV194]
MKRKVVALLMVLSLVIGAGGMYGYMQWSNKDQSLGNAGSVSEMKSTKAPVNQDQEFAKLQKTYELISSRYYQKVDSEKLLEGAIDGMVRTLKDPYSVYMDEDTASQFTQSLDSSFEGIGTEVSMQDGKVTVIAPFKDSPAERSGVKPNDQIVSVDGKSLEGLDLYQAVLKIRGKKGSTVTLGIKRKGVNDTLNIDVKRDTIPIETVYSNVRNVNGKKIGVLNITSFSEDTGTDFKDKLGELESKGIQGLVIDVRGNPGGYLNAVDSMLKEIIPAGKPFVQIQDRKGNKERYVSQLKEKKAYPIVGLVDGGSASASEIMAGALKEAGGYPLVGEKTFGKGTVQQTIDLGDGSNVKLTLAKWLTPDGNWIHKKGIKPNYAVKQPAYFYTSPLTIEKPLVFDMNSEQVKNAQKMLQGLGFDPGRTDGYFDEKTETAVTAFQKANKLSPSGKVDQKTAGKLESKIITEIRNKKNDVQLQTALEMAAEKKK